jgi:hypothetical protein
MARLTGWQQAWVIVAAGWALTAFSPWNAWRQLACLAALALVLSFFHAPSPRDHV